MTKLLFLLRHAKSSWDDAQLQDVDRPLNTRGRMAAKTMGQHMARKGLISLAVLCSPAVRTRQTWNILSKQLKNAPTPTIIPELYDFGDGDAVLTCIRKAEDSDASLMIIGHNPALHNLARRLIIMADSDRHQRLNTKFPTCALAVISFDRDSWKDIAEGSGTLKHFIRPKDLDSKP
jgi:phosphohistidine phosphatase